MTRRNGRVVLVGAGHAHVGLLRRADALLGAAGEVVLVTPGDLWYSGLATGVVAGLYPPALDRIDVVRLAESKGVRAVVDRAVAADPGRRELSLASGEILGWDVLSVNVGSRTLPEHLPGRGPPCIPVKPLTALLELPPLLDTLGPDRRDVVVVGGGPSGCEVALSIAGRYEGRSPGVRVTLLTRSGIVPDFPAGAQRSLRDAFSERGVGLREETPVAEIADGGVRLEGGEIVDADVVVQATGLEAVELVGRLGLPVDGMGALLVDRTLRSVAGAPVYGAGDCVAFEDGPLARVGVHAVRQTPVLLRNLVAELSGGEPKAYDPPDRYLLILNLGDGTGLAVRGGLHWRGRASFWLKDRLDRRFLSGKDPLPFAGFWAEFWAGF